MKMKTGKEGRQLICEVWAAKDLKILGNCPRDLDPDTIGYAVCRFLTKCDLLCREYVEQSYRLRLARGRKRRPVKSFFTAPARKLELPGCYLQAEVLISPAGVEVCCVEFAAVKEKLKKHHMKKDRPVIRVYRSAS